MSQNDFTNNAQKMEFSIKDFFSKCDHIRSKLEKVQGHVLSALMVTAWNQMLRKLMVN